MWCKCNTVYSTVHVCLRNKILNLTTYNVHYKENVRVISTIYIFVNDFIYIQWPLLTPTEFL